MFRLITANRTQGTDVVLWGRGADGYKYDFLIPFEPYIYCLESESIRAKHDAIVRAEPGGVSCFGDKLLKLVLRNPSDAPRVRDLFTKTFEADIPYPRRFCIDRQITSGFDIDFLPCEPPQVPLDIHTLDIECYSRGGMPDPDVDPITCATIGDSDCGFATIVLDDKRRTVKKSDKWVVLHEETEESLIKILLNMIKVGDVLLGWNIEFDLEYLKKRSKGEYKLDVDLNGVCVFDLLTAYRGLYRRKSYRLKDIVMDEKFTTELEPNVDYGAMWDKDRPGLVTRNKRHAEWVSQIDAKLKITDYFWNLKETAGLERLEDCLHNSVLIDTMFLRRTSSPLPTKGGNVSSPFEGAMVIQPPTGVFENVGDFDMSQFYPTTARAEILDPLIIHSFLKEIGEEGEDKVDWEAYHEYAKFYLEARNPVLLLPLLEEMMTKRRELQAAGHKEKLASIKGLVNSLYGVLAHPGFRMFEPRLAARITERAREVISSLITTVRSEGYDVKYADTDSIWLQVPKSEVAALETHMNDELKKMGDYVIKLDAYCPRVAFFGVKKRYCYIDEKGELHTTGFETRRTDSSNYTKDVMNRVMKMLLSGQAEGLVPYVRSVVAGVKQAPIMDVCLTKGFGQDFEVERKGEQAYIKACRSSGIEMRQGDFIRMVPAKNYQYGVCVFRDESDLKKKPEIDWDEVVRTQIKAKVEHFLEVAGHSWDEVQGQSRMAL